MTKHTSIVFLASLLILIGLGSCKKINEATELGGDLIPAVDNIHTFEVAVNTETDNRQFGDTTKVLRGDYLALGHLNDLEFGPTHANFHFSITPSALGSNPFVHKDSILVDSVVLSLSYKSGYGDTANAMQTVHVFEIDQNSNFRSDSLYRYADPATDFATTGAELGSKTFRVSELKDSIKLIRKDTTKVANVLRIRLDNSLGYRFASYDTTSGPLGGYHNDSTGGSTFRNLFKGFAVKADNGGNVLTYYNIDDASNTKLTVYYQLLHPATGKSDTLSFDFIHASNGQANYVKMTPGAGWGSYLNNGLASDDKIYLQSSPSGAYASILMPGLDTLKNKVIHSAELILTNISPDNIFTAPQQLFLDRKNNETPDTLNLLYRDLAPNSNGTFSFSSFGGNLKYDTYRLNITRYVQGIVTRHEAIDTLRLYAPYRANSIYGPMFVSSTNPKGLISIQVGSTIYDGRVVLAGGSYSNPDKRPRLRIVYSNL